METITITRAQLRDIQIGLNLLNGIRGLRLGIIRDEISSVILPFIRSQESWMNNDEYKLLDQKIMEANKRFTDPDRRKAEVAALFTEHKQLIAERFQQLLEYEKILEENISIEIQRKIPVSLLPENETPNEVVTLCKPIIQFDA